MALPDSRSSSSSLGGTPPTAGFTDPGSAAAASTQPRDVRAQALPDPADLPDQLSSVASVVKEVNELAKSGTQLLSNLGALLQPLMKKRPVGGGQAAQPAAGAAGQPNTQGQAAQPAAGAAGPPSAAAGQPDKQGQAGQAAQPASAEREARLRTAEAAVLAAKLEAEQELARLRTEAAVLAAKREAEQERGRLRTEAAVLAAKVALLEEQNAALRQAFQELRQASQECEEERSYLYTQGKVVEAELARLRAQLEAKDA